MQSAYVRAIMIPRSPLFRTSQRRRRPHEAPFGSTTNAPGCFGGGTHEFKIVKAPFISPEPPSPAIARPMINIDDEVAEPQIADPISKRSRKVIYDHCTERISSTYSGQHRRGKDGLQTRLGVKS